MTTYICADQFIGICEWPKNHGYLGFLSSLAAPSTQDYYTGYGTHAIY